MSTPRVLFLCTGNSCRSQMAEGWLRELAGERIEALSAGTEPAGVNPIAVATMASRGVDIASQSSDDVRDYLADPPDLVIAVCDRAAESCPAFPARVPVLRWPFPDPAHFAGGRDEVSTAFLEVASQIRDRIRVWLEDGAAPLRLSG